MVQQNSFARLQELCATQDTRWIRRRRKLDTFALLACICARTPVPPLSLQQRRSSSGAASAPRPRSAVPQLRGQWASSPTYVKDAKVCTSASTMSCKVARGTARHRCARRGAAAVMQRSARGGGATLCGGGGGATLRVPQPFHLSHFYRAANQIDVAEARASAARDVVTQTQESATRRAIA